MISARARRGEFVGVPPREMDEMDSPSNSILWPAGRKGREGERKEVLFAFPNLAGFTGAGESSLSWSGMSLLQRLSALVTQVTAANAARNEAAAAAAATASKAAAAASTAPSPLPSTGPGQPPASPTPNAPSQDIDPLKEANPEFLKLLRQMSITNQPMAVGPSEEQFKLAKQHFPQDAQPRGRSQPKPEAVPADPSRPQFAGTTQLDAAKKLAESYGFPAPAEEEVYRDAAGTFSFSVIPAPCALTTRSRLTRTVPTCCA